MSVKPSVFSSSISFSSSNIQDQNPLALVSNSLEKGACQTHLSSSRLGTYKSFPRRPLRNVYPKGVPLDFPRQLRRAAGVPGADPQRRQLRGARQSAQRLLELPRRRHRQPVVSARCEGRRRALLGRGRRDRPGGRSRPRVLRRRRRHAPAESRKPVRATDRRPNLRWVDRRRAEGIRGRAGAPCHQAAQVVPQLRPVGCAGKHRLDGLEFFLRLRVVEAGPDRAPPRYVCLDVAIFHPLGSGK
ncbi:hypothetical protein F4818DRAFT_71995 [Hypoxylon cercidicola]|nr:hypothetical protein F4818DRAFT_71995 [Hypoxylon cercidicola]